jgi:hypothetical protein
MARTPVANEKEPSILAAVLQGLAMLLLALGTLAAVWLALEAASAGRFDLAVAWQVGLAFLGGVALAATFWFAGYLVRQTARAEASQRMLLGLIQHLIQVSPVPPHVHEHTNGHPADALPMPPGRTQAGAATVSPVLESQLLEQLRELNVNLLLTEEQKRLKRQLVLLPQAQALAEEVRKLVATGDVKPAWQALQRLVQMAPDLSDLDALRAKIEDTGREAETRDLEQARRWVRDFEAAEDFTAAEAAATHMLAEYPQSLEAMALLAQVRGERVNLQDERRLKMYQQIQQQVTAKHWAAALAAAEQFTRAYAGTSEAENLLQQLPTLRDNAAIEQARAMRDNIAALIAGRQFSQALSLAQQAIERFPHTAVAEELRQGMAKLEEGARLEELAKATGQSQ